LYTPNDPLAAITDQQKIDLLQAADRYARAADKRVTEVMASLSGVHEVILVVNLEGKQVADVRPLVRVNINVIVDDNGKRESGSTGGGGRFSYEGLTDALVKEYAACCTRVRLARYFIA